MNNMFQDLDMNKDFTPEQSETVKKTFKDLCDTTDQMVNNTHERAQTYIEYSAKSLEQLEANFAAGRIDKESFIEERNKIDEAVRQMLKDANAADDTKHKRVWGMALTVLGVISSGAVLILISKILNESFGTSASSSTGAKSSTSKAA